MSEPVHTSETPPAESIAGTLDIAEGLGPKIDAAIEEAIPGAEHLGDPGKQALDRIKAERNQIRSDRDALKARLKEIEDRDLSELQKAQRDREEALTRLASIEQEAVRNRVALAKGLPADIAATLNGANEEELAAHADRLIAWRGNVPPTTPRPDPGQGPRPSTPLAEEEAEYARFFPQG